VRRAHDGLGDVARRVGIDVREFRDLAETRSVEALSRPGLIRPAEAGADLPTLLGRLGEGTRHVAAAAPPYAGVHVDVRARTVGWWSATAAPGTTGELPARWPGREVSPWDDGVWQDGYDRQLTACHGAVRAPAVDLLPGLEWLRKALAREGYPYPAAAFEQVRAGPTGRP
jgi:hypothetical protein